MISLYSGTPRSGKSLHAAKDIRERLQTKKSITIGTFYVNPKSVKKHSGFYLYVNMYDLSPERLISFAKSVSSHLGRRLKEGEIVVYIDEAQRLFNSRDWNTPARREWLTFFAEHGHYGYDFVLIAQFDRMLDRQVRCLIEYEYIHRKIKNAGKFGKFLSFMTGGTLFVYIKKWYPIRETVNTIFFFGSKRVYSLYDSYEFFAPPAASDPLTVKKRGRMRSG